jgi:hypothetical protein
MERIQAARTFELALAVGQKQTIPMDCFGLTIPRITQTKPSFGSSGGLSIVVN